MMYKAHANRIFILLVTALLVISSACSSKSSKIEKSVLETELKLGVKIDRYQDSGNSVVPILFVYVSKKLDKLMESKLALDLSENLKKNKINYTLIEIITPGTDSELHDVVVLDYVNKMKTDLESNLGNLRNFLEDKMDEKLKNDIITNQTLKTADSLYVESDFLGYVSANKGKMLLVQVYFKINAADTVFFVYDYNGEKDKIIGVGIN